MKSDKVILVAGGDLRQQYAAQRLRQKTGAAVWTVGLPAQPNLHFAETPAEVPAYDVLVLPVLAGSSGETVPAPFGTSPLIRAYAAYPTLALIFLNCDMVSSFSADAIDRSNTKFSVATN